MTTRLSGLKDVPRDDKTLYLTGAAKDLEGLRVAHEFLDRIITVVAIAAEDLRCGKR